MANQIEILSIMEGFYQSSVLFALVRLNIFERIGDTSASVEELAEQLQAQPDTLARLLNAGVMLKFLQTTDGQHYRLTPQYRAVMLPSAGQHYLGDWIRLQDEFWHAHLRLDKAVLQSAPTADQLDYLGNESERTQIYIRAMHNYAAVRGKELARYLDTGGCRSLLDIGCGSGTYAFHIGKKNPELKLYLSDLPGVLDVTKEIAAEYGVENEVHYLPLDAAKDDIPGNYDLILASNMVQYFDEKTRTGLLQRLFHAVNPGGSLVIQAQHFNKNRIGGRWPMFVDLNLLTTTPTGKNHSTEETREWLAATGFKNIEVCWMSIYSSTSFVRGYK